MLLHPDDRYVWEDLGKPIDTIIDGGIAAFTRKFGQVPNRIEVRAGVETSRPVVFTTIVPNAYQVWLSYLEVAYDNATNEAPETIITVPSAEIPLTIFEEDGNFWG